MALNEVVIAGKKYKWMPIKGPKLVYTESKDAYYMIGPKDDLFLLIDPSGKYAVIDRSQADKLIFKSKDAQTRAKDG